MTATQTPWHGIGQTIEDDANLVESAGLDWTVEQRPLYLGKNVNAWNEDGVTPTTVPTAEKVETHVANYRSDTNEVLAVVGSGYEVFQNDELAELVEAIEGDGDAEVESALSMREGRDVFFLMKNSSFELPGNDKVHTYHIFGNNHSGERSLYVLPTSIRVWCSNMLNMVYKQSKGGFKIRHTTSMKSRVEEAVEQIKRSKVIAEKFRINCEKLAEKRLQQDQVEDYFDTVYTNQYGAIPEWDADMSPGDQSKLTRYNDINLDWTQNLGADMERSGTDRNAWLALNSITEWIDHGRTVRGESRGDKMRTHSNLLGSAANMKQMALNEALALV